MRHALQRVALPVREIVGRVDRPLVAGARVRRMEDAVKHRVAQVHVPRRHVDPRPQHARAGGEFARPHPFEQRAVLGRSPAAARAVRPRLRQRPAVFADLLRRLVVHIGEAPGDQMAREVVKRGEIVRREGAGPVRREAEPAHVALDGVGVGLVLLLRIGVVEAQAAAPAELPRDAEIEADRFRVADMQVAVRLRRKPRRDLRRAPRRQIGGHVGGHRVANEVAAPAVRAPGHRRGVTLPRRRRRTPRAPAGTRLSPPERRNRSPLATALRESPRGSRRCAARRARAV